MSFLNPLAEVTDYHTMLNRIFWFTTASAVIATVLFRRFFPDVDAILTYLDFRIEYYGMKIPLGYVIPGLLVGIVARTVHLHDRISDVLGIRKRFDVKFILVPLAIGAGIRQKDINLGMVEASRDELMDSAFYRYTSSKAKETIVDKHLICEALSWWSWYWVVVESTSILSIVALILLFAKAWATVAMILACIVASLGVLRFFKHHCARYAKREVQEILSDSTRQNEVKEQMAKCIIGQKDT